MSNKKRLYLIDGSGFIFRAYYAFPPLSRADKTPIGAVLGFCNMLVKLLKDMEAHSLAVVFDAQRKNFRHDLYPAYKINRLETPPDLIPQFPLVRQACQAFGIPSLECPVFEADDIIATYTYRAIQQGMEVVIVSSDKDLMQLVQKDVSIYDPIKNAFLQEKEVQEKFGVPASQVIEVQALAGDASDNIPGVPGIGPKTAAQLIQQFHTLENLFAHLDQLPPSKRKEVLGANRDLAFLSRQLVSLNAAVPLETSLESLEPQQNLEGLRAFLQEQGFKSLERRLFTNGSSLQPSAVISSHYEKVTTLSHLQEWIQKLSRSPIIGFDTETDSQQALPAQLVGVSFCIEKGKACYIPVHYRKKSLSLFSSAAEEVLELSVVLDEIKPLLENPAIKKVGHNIKYDKLVLKKYGIEVKAYEDSILLSYLLNAGRHALDVVVEEHFHHRMTTFKELVKSSKENFSDVPLDQATQYAAEDADYTLRLYHLFYPQLSPSLKKLYEGIDLPLVDVLIHMEQAGIKVDAAQLQQLSYTFDQTLEALAKEIFEMAKGEFNIGSPKQLGEILFERLQLPAGKKSKTGAYATDSATLENLTLVHPIVEKILEWRQISKLKSTYTENLIQAINPATQRLHTSYGMTITTTGRLSSSDPNLQNIPVRTEEGKKIRRCFVAEKRHQLISFDYSQIELRLLAHFASIPALEEAFKHGADIHTLTASQVFATPVEEVSAALRSKAKAINFGIIYGISAFGLARQLKISPKQAAHYIDLYHVQYPGIQEYMRQMVSFAQQKGYVETLWGRRCYVPNIQAKNPALRSFAERQAINAPLQGTNADLIKKAMIQIDAWLQQSDLKTKMLLQVHDELIFEAPLEEVSLILQSIHSIMTSVCTLKVPLLVEVSKGDNWQDTYPVSL